jgi:hypothetical protein
MIELTEQQRSALHGSEQPPVVVDPATGQKYRLIRQEIYELVGGILKPFNRGWEDDPDMDVYEQFRKKPEEKGVKGKKKVSGSDTRSKQIGS